MPFWRAVLRKPLLHLGTFFIPFHLRHFYFSALCNPFQKLTFIFFLLCQISSQTRNAQLAFLRAHPEASLPKIQHPMKFWGVGAPIHIVRNSVALSGFRLVSGHIREPFEKISNSMGIAVSRSRMNVLCDFTGCLCTLFVTVIKFKVLSYQ